MHSNTIINPRAMMIHSKNTIFTNWTVVRFNRFYIVTFCAEFPISRSQRAKREVSIFCKRSYSLTDTLQNCVLVNVNLFKRWFSIQFCSMKLISILIVIYTYSCYNCHNVIKADAIILINKQYIVKYKENDICVVFQRFPCNSSIKINKSP